MVSQVVFSSYAFERSKIEKSGSPLNSTATSLSSYVKDDSLSVPRAGQLRHLCILVFSHFNLEWKERRRVEAKWLVSLDTTTTGSYCTPVWLVSLTLAVVATPHHVRPTWPAAALHPSVSRFHLSLSFIAARGGQACLLCLWKETSIMVNVRPPAGPQSLSHYSPITRGNSRCPMTNIILQPAVFFETACCLPVLINYSKKLARLLEKWQNELYPILVV